jgi:hypothetical protein
VNCHKTEQGAILAIFAQQKSNSAAGDDPPQEPVRDGVLIRPAWRFFVSLFFICGLV